VSYAKRLLSPEVVLPPASEVAGALGRAPALKESARLIAELIREDLLSAVRNLEKQFQQVIEDETVKECYKKKIIDYLQKIERNPVDEIAEELRIRTVISLKREVGEGIAKIIIADPGIAQPRAYVVFSNGIAIGFDLKEGAPPLLPLLLETTGWGLSSNGWGLLSSIRLQVTLAQILKGAARAGRYGLKVKVLPRENIAESLCKELHETHVTYEKYWLKVRTADADVLLALLLLSGWKMRALECKRFGEAECFAVAVEDLEGMGRLELLVPSGVRVRDEDLDINAPLKDVVERLRNEEGSRDFIVRYFTVKFIYKIVFECSENLKKMLKEEGMEKILKEWKEETKQLLKILKN
jgi:hypothetical protein